MPIYEYRCRHCQHQFDKLQKMHAVPLKTCPQCGDEALIKLVSAPGFQLKGSGWYVTDFRDKGKKPDQTNGAEKSAENDEGGGSSADTTTTEGADKPAAKQEQETV